jgi:uncharacterized protein (DUF3084 family)
MREHEAAVRVSEHEDERLKLAVEHFRMHAPGSENPMTPEETEELRTALLEAQQNVAKLDAENKDLEPRIKRVRRLIRRV